MVDQFTLFSVTTMSKTALADNTPAQGTRA